MSTVTCLWCHSIVDEVLNLKRYVTAYVTFLLPLVMPRTYTLMRMSWSYIAFPENTNFLNI